MRGRGSDVLFPASTDAAIAVGAAALEVGHALLLQRQAGEPDLQPLGLLLLLVQTLPLAWRRRWPLTVPAISGLALAVYGATDNPDPFFVGPLFALAMVVAHVPRRAAVAILVVTLAIALASASVAGDSDIADYFLSFLLIIVTWLAGYAINLRTAYVAELRDKFERLEHEQEEAARRAAAEERVRIARELHDVVAHHVSSMVVQAEAAAQDGIADTGRSALEELRRLLGVLRSGADAPLSPQPGLADIDALAEPLRRAGVAVDVHRSGNETGLSPGIELCAYRIVQEALTNVIRHAHASHASVTVRADDQALAVEVSDDGRGRGNGPGGHGLAGIAERVALYGGTLDTGPQPDGGFAVRARLPLTDES